MSSRFVSAGAIDAASGEAVDVPPPLAAAAAVAAVNREGGPNAAETGVGRGGARSEEWAAVQRELDGERRRREEERRKAAGAEKSLYEVLEANKAAKQAEFEEKNKIRNQFRPLDDDEVDFLEGVRSSGRAAEERIRRETEERLDAFRAAQRKREEADAAAAAGGGGGGGGGDDAAAGPEGEPESWAVSAGRKRKRVKEKEGGGKSGIRGLKRQQASESLGGKGDGQDLVGAAGKKSVAEGGLSASELSKHEPQTAGRTKPSSASSKPKLGLVDYGSGDDDDDD